jgi:hypothetical protein
MLLQQGRDYSLAATICKLNCTPLGHKAYDNRRRQNQFIVAARSDLPLLPNLWFSVIVIFVWSRVNLPSRIIDASLS